MTITNDERRKVAARLRKERENLESVLVPNDLEELCFTYLYHIAKVIGRGEIFTNLADLIEPEPERTVKSFKDRGIDGIWRSYCSECGYEVVNYCPICGFKVEQ